ncbi:EAL domain-containing protein [Microvirga aerilata]|uniref:EAL domain-containing protein n=1 Tax=Microvirga aerilata TaxID=670292 RepID=A0A936ZHU2_9HYPH|nr:EAL domain-containing protein [Microvirga aerilata]MBL0404828.1 EAL domain-containing protein [Microvirga aerilata]
MVTNKKKIPVLRDGKAALLAFTPAFLMAAASPYVPMEAGLVMPVTALLITAVFLGPIILWRRAERDRSILSRQSAELDRQVLNLKDPNRAAPLVLRPAKADARCPAGVLRELAKAAGDQDLAQQAASGVPDRTRPAKPVLTLVPDGPPAQPKFPEPTLLPSMWNSTDEQVSRMGLVTQAFEADRIELHLQPVVSLPHQKIRFYEALARLRLADGTLLGPSEFLPVLECLGHAPEFDRRVLTRVMAVAGHLAARGSEAIVGLNLSAHSIAEPGFLWSLEGLLDRSPEILGRIVLELPQHSWRHLDPDQKAALAALRDKGVPFSLDRAADLRFDPRVLADLGIRFMKLPADLMVAAAEQDKGLHAGPELSVWDFASALRRQGVKLIAERVDRDEMVPVLCSLGAPLAQGFAFAAPRPVRAEVVERGARPQPVASEDMRPLLRRAG